MRSVPPSSEVAVRVPHWAVMSLAMFVASGIGAIIIGSSVDDQVRNDPVWGAALKVVVFLTIAAAALGFYFDHLREKRREEYKKFLDELSHEIH
jgi:hypothetical protein